MAGSARDEAERLVATILAMAGGGDQGAAADGPGDPSGTRERATAGLGVLGDSLAGIVTRLAGPSSGPGSSDGWSTGSAECCVCPLCRAIAAVRDPSPEATERVATGAGDIAMGVASLMRGFAAMSKARPAPRPAPASRPARPGNADETWSTATRRATTRPGATGAWPAAGGDTASSAPGAPAARTGGAGVGGAESGGTESELGGAVGAERAEFGTVAGDDAWSAATTASAAAADAAAAVERAAAQRAAAKAAASRAAAAADRVAQAVALADAARAAAAANAGATSGDSGSGTDGWGGGAAQRRTAGGFDVWAAATAEADVADVARPVTVDHVVPGVSAPEDRGGAAGDEARDSDPV